jgi:hypothetical protein
LAGREWYFGERLSSEGNGELTKAMTYYKPKFVCPECGSDSGIVAEVLVPESRELRELKESKHGVIEPILDSFNLGLSYDFEVEEFMCGDCEKTIAHNEYDLYKWLKEHDMLEVRE